MVAFPSPQLALVVVKMSRSFGMVTTVGVDVPTAEITNADYTILNEKR